MDYLLVALVAVLILLMVILLFQVRKQGKQTDVPLLQQQLEQFRREVVEQSREDRRETAENSQKTMESLGRVLADNQQTAATAQNQLLNEATQHLNQKQAALQQAVTDQLAGMDRRVQALSQDNSCLLYTSRCV